MKLYDKEKFADILSGVLKPVDKKEEVLLIAYKQSVKGEQLQSVIISEFYTMFETMTKEELLYVIYGYAVGQILADSRARTLITMPTNNGSKYEQ